MIVIAGHVLDDIGLWLSFIITIKHNIYTYLFFYSMLAKTEHFIS